MLYNLLKLDEAWCFILDELLDKTTVQGRSAAWGRSAVLHWYILLKFGGIANTRLVRNLWCITHRMKYIRYCTVQMDNFWYLFCLPPFPCAIYLTRGLHKVELSTLLGCKFWTRLLGSWKHVSRSQYVLIRKLWEIKVWFLYLKGSSNKWWYMCVSCRILDNPIVFDTCYWWTHVPSVLCGCACRRVYVRGSLVIGLIWVPIQVLLRTRWYLSTL